MRLIHWLVLGLLIIVVLVAGVAVGIGLDRTILANRQAAPVADGQGINKSLLDEAYGVIQQYYVDRKAIQDKSLTYGAISGMVDALGDTGHSRFLSPETLNQENQDLQAEFTGIGVNIETQDGAVVVVSPIDGSPAEKAGIKAGMIFLKVNGEDVSGLGIIEIQKRVLGPEGTEVTVTMFDPATSTAKDFTVKRARIAVTNVSWAMLPGTQIAHLRIAEFSARVGDDLIKALKEMKAQNVQGIILDLRDNRGGYLEEAEIVVSQFIAKGNVLLQRDAQGNVEKVPVKRGGIATDIPLIVLINQGSASAAEITAGAIQDYQRAQLVGETTFGTGTVLNTISLSDGSALLLAVREWLTPNGREIWHQGIKPDVEVKLPTEAQSLRPIKETNLTEDALKNSGDTQLLKALELLSAQLGAGN